jgi:hypothetical protein
VTSAPAVLPLWAATSRNATNARIASSPITPALWGAFSNGEFAPESTPDWPFRPDWADGDSPLAEGLLLR